MSPRFFFLVLAAASVCRGQNQTATSRNRTSDALSTLGTPPMDTSTPTALYHHNRTSPNQPGVPSTATAQTAGTEGPTTTVSHELHDPSERKPTTPAEEDLVSTTAPSVTTAAAPVGGHDSWGYILLVLLLLVIIILLVILYLLRKASRTYSFDLQRPAPGNHGGGPAGDFEAFSLDNQGQATPCDRSTSPAANGTAPQSEEHAPQEAAHVNHSKASDIGDSYPAILDDSLEKSDPSDAAQEERDKADSSPPGSSGLLAEKDLNEPLRLKPLFASPGTSSSSSSASYLD
ncbi:uncharacterized protein LOC133472740 [Phyllopteryx taeniolatus]|uniref:uncharacterized protein LOC133472740 n=1 Tax=Phyllopteryx taeniolatus TaxID=161469 RepID=UPI002AD2338E|nr:uncharacterized protein LOC133472740 [Phyllopteryx taeniolatus]